MKSNETIFWQYYSNESFPNISADPLSDDMDVSKSPVAVLKNGKMQGKSFPLQKLTSPTLLALVGLLNRKLLFQCRFVYFQNLFVGIYFAHSTKHALLIQWTIIDIEMNSQFILVKYSSINEHDFFFDFLVSIYM